MASVEIRYCPQAQQFTLEKKGSTGEPSESVLPPKYTPQDTYGKYRRQAKKEELERTGLW